MARRGQKHAKSGKIPRKIDLILPSVQAKPGRGISGGDGQTIKGQYEQDPKRRLGDFGRTGDAHRKT